ncbi:ARM repeat-containing protein [Nadsonia fulvescens var. elongata DSM 6958]|uniref:ARM repeat-containing protein n=1 Tax=Nadsonia fulvescens var. elongata DSM 6958 TaxID=857566 RepID=A0A1E3PFL9_9ASCO|nr:ARM repeat-containing protein [Nadsonia fulvescens var. elongata DSM 6958]
MESPSTPWTLVIESQKDIFSSSVKTRVEFLTTLNNAIKSQQLSEAELPLVLKLLFSTYPHYTDGVSRNAVLSSFNLLFTAFPVQMVLNKLSAVCKKLATAAQSHAIAVSDLMTVLSWVNIFIETAAKDSSLDINSDMIKNLIVSQAILLENCFSGKDSKRNRLAESSFRNTRSSMVKVFSQNAEYVSLYITTLAVPSSVVSSSTTYNLAPALGASVLACRDLNATKPQVYESFTANKALIYTYFIREVLGAKKVSPPGEHITSSLYALWEETSAQEFETLILPSLDKAMLRSPEVVLAGPIPSVLKHLPLTVDLSASLKAKLATPLVSALKSSTPATRVAALETFSIALNHCYDETVITKIVEEFLTKPLRTNKVANAEHRVIYAKVLQSVAKKSAALSAIIANDLIAVTLKEINETALAALTTSLFMHIIAASLTDVAVSTDIIAGITKIFADKRMNLRKVWIVTLVEQTYQIIEDNKATATLKTFIEAILPTALKTWEEIIAGPMPFVQNKTVSQAFAIMVLCESIKANWSDSQSVLAMIDSADVLAKSTYNEAKPSLVLSHRIYTKLTTYEETVWAVRALGLVSRSVNQDALESTKILVAQAWLHFIMSAEVDPESRRLAAELLKQVNLANQAIVGDAVIHVLENNYVLNNMDTTLAEPEAQAHVYALPNKFLSMLIGSLINEEAVSRSHEILLAQLVKLLVPLHHERAVIKNGWIGITLRAGIDPGEGVRQFSKEILAQVVQYASLVAIGEEKDTINQIKQAAFNTCATVAFISPEFFAGEFSNIIQSDLKNISGSSITEENVMIWNTPAGTLAVDVLSKGKAKYTENKNSKDYAEKKWEENLRKEIDAKRANSASAKKKQPVEKLTKDEQAKVDEQMAKEIIIREKINDIYIRVSRSVGIIAALSREAAKDIDNGILTWYAPACTGLTQALVNNVSILVGPAAVEAFFALSENMTRRLGNMRKFMAVAILRASDVEIPDKNLIEESLKSLVLRVLYRLKFLSDQRPFDSVTLIFILPLVLRVLKERGISTTDEEEVDEQLMLALEILTAHAESFADPITPRLTVLTSLLALMVDITSKAKQSKECLLGIVRSIAVNYTKEELNLLLKNAVSESTFVRTTVLEAIDSELDLSEMITYAPQLHIARFDCEEINADFAQTIWDENKLVIADNAIEQLFGYLDLPTTPLRMAVAEAIAEAVTKQGRFHEAFPKLLDFYREKTKPAEPELDEFGLAKAYVNKDFWEARSGCALTLKNLASLFDVASVQTLFTFLIDEQALADPDTNARQEFQDAGVEVINQNGLDSIEDLMIVFQSCLNAPDIGSEAQDKIRESTIILYGALARHLKSSDDRLPTIIERLLKALETPSEDVQYAVSECIPPLIKLVSDKVGSYIKLLVNKLLNSESFAERRGAAYGIAGIVKGAGISALTDFDIIRSLEDAIENKKEPKQRQGAQFAIECLSLSLGKFFEPYVIEMLPLIIACLGDTTADVREAASYSSRQVMKHTTAYGVKKLIPLTLENLDQTQWRAKRGAVDLLGSMAYLDPQQLSSSLSIIIPEIVAVLNDTHKEVRKAADASLQKFGEVIRNPEIQNLVPILIKATSDPTKYTEDALNALLKTQFVHYIDAPSLALVIHVLQRGLRDRSASIKRKACQIVGNMSILTDSKDLAPYLPIIVSELQVSMVDPVPATRATASRALGSLVEKLGEEKFPTLVDDLLDILKSEDRAGDRIGAAQGLSEVICGLGMRKLEELLPSILENCSSPRSHVREGYMPLMVFLPACFGNALAPHLSQIIPPILAGLADEVEGVRETSLRAGRLLVKNYASKAVDLLLPELERGLSDINHRIRLSSVELTGDLLFQVTGITGKIDAEDDIDISGEVNKALIETLGQERRDRVLAMLFVCRSDTFGMVRNAALDVWKSLVANTPRTVKEILPALTQIIIRKLASSNEEQRSIAAQTLGEMVRRAGGNALSQLIPTFQESLRYGDSDAKQGICIALNELIKTTPYENMESFQKELVGIVRDALVDRDPVVRSSAAETFDSLQNVIGNSAIDQILPNLISMLHSDESSNAALAALKDIMATKSNIIFPVLIPTLLTTPITAFNARALGSLATVAGSALYRRLAAIINALMDTILDDNVAAETKEEVSEALDTIILSVDEDEGCHPLMQHLIALAKHESPRCRELTYQHMATFFAQSSLDFSSYTQDWIGYTLQALEDKDQGVVKAAWAALSAITKQLSKEEMEKLVKPTRQTLRITGYPGQDLPGFLLPRGPSCILPIFFHGLMYGAADVREQAALGIADIVERTSVDNLKPFVTQMAGPLIRTIGERFPSDVKSAILYTLNVLLNKIPAFLKPFLPQLQRTFAKSLSDASNESLRNRAAEALGTLITLQARVDPLVSELVLGVKNSTDKGVTVAMLKALDQVISKAGKNMSDASKASVLTLIDEQIYEAQETTVVLLARMLGSLASVVGAEDAGKLITGYVFEMTDKKISALVLNAMLRFATPQIVANELSEQVVEYIIKGMRSSDSFMCEKSVIASGKYLLSDDTEVNSEISSSIITVLAEVMLKPVSNSSDARRLALVVERTLALNKYQLVEPHIDILGPATFGCVREMIIPIKLAAEKAYLALFKLVEEGAAIFDTWMSGSGAELANARTIQDYTRRVAMRLASAEKERIEAGGDNETVYSDRIEDKQEIWAIGSITFANLTQQE